MEINIGGYLHRTHENIENAPEMRMFRIAKKCGCKFMFGSDSHHANGHYEYSNCADFVAAYLELCESDIAEFAK